MTQTSENSLHGVNSDTGVYRNIEVANRDRLGQVIKYHVTLTSYLKPAFVEIGVFGAEMPDSMPGGVFFCGQSAGTAGLRRSFPESLKNRLEMLLSEGFTLTPLGPSLYSATALGSKFGSVRANSIDPTLNSQHVADPVRIVGVKGRFNSRRKECQDFGS